MFWLGGGRGGAVGSLVGTAVAGWLRRGVGTEEGVGDAGGGFEGGGGGRVVSTARL